VWSARALFLLLAPLRYCSAGPTDSPLSTHGGIHGNRFKGIVHGITFIGRDERTRKASVVFLVLLHLLLILVLLLLSRELTLDRSCHVQSIAEDVRNAVALVVVSAAAATT